jgi:hypothetical protein
VQKGGLLVGEPLREFQGVLTGVPHYTGGSAPLLNEDGSGGFQQRALEQSSDDGDRVEKGIGENGRKRSHKTSRD